MEDREARRRAQTRSAIWADVWCDRDDDRADWNGLEACFDDLHAYEKWVGDVAAVIRERLRLMESDVVADLGCGTGRVAERLAPHVSFVHGFDYSETVLRVARDRRRLPNVDFQHADLNDFDPRGIALTKAFSVGAMLYLDAKEQVFNLIRQLHARHIDIALLDLPDATLVDDRPRAYDTSIFTHLRFNEEELLAEFPTAYVKRGEFPQYVNGKTRFNFYLHAVRPK